MNQAPIVRVGPELPQILTGGTYELLGAPERRLCQAQFEDPTPVVAYALIDKAKNPLVQSVFQETSGKFLVILGRAHIGCNGSSYDFLFDIPFGHVVQIPAICQSIEISARYAYVAQEYITQVGLQPPTLNTWQNPGDIRGVPVRNANVTGMVGRGTCGTGTAIRRAQVKFGQAVPLATLNVPPPTGATHFRVLGKPGTTTYSIQTPLSTVENIGPFDISNTPDQEWIPLPSPVDFVQVINPFGGLGVHQPVEIAFKMGLDGVA